MPGLPFDPSARGRANRSDEIPRNGRLVPRRIASADLKGRLSRKIAQTAAFAVMAGNTFQLFC
jgi:hypothetical protein